MRKSFCSAAASFLTAAAFASIALTALTLIGVGSFNLGFALTAPVIFFPFALVAVVVLGIPTFLLMRPLAPGTWWMAVFAGLVLGIVLRGILLLILQASLDVPIELLTALSTLVFWLVWRWGEKREGACCACARP